MEKLTMMDLAVIRNALQTELRVNPGPADKHVQAAYDKIVAECARRA